MAKISEMSVQDLSELNNLIYNEISQCKSLEDASQKYMDLLFIKCQESIVLCRFFLSLPYKQVPEEKQEFVLKLSEDAEIKHLIKDDIMILTLLGTHGVCDDWNDCKKSKGHIGIPLASATFIDRVPMMSRLLKQFGAGIDWIDSGDTKFVVKTMGDLSGVFYVENAMTERDAKDRLIIAAQDFVNEYKVKTVFGIGGGYLGTPYFFTTIVFLNEFIDKKKAERFMLQANRFKTATLETVFNNKMFKS